MTDANPDNFYSLSMKLENQINKINKTKKRLEALGPYYVVNCKIKGSHLKGEQVAVFHEAGKEPFWIYTRTVDLHKYAKSKNELNIEEFEFEFEKLDSISDSDFVFSSLVEPTTEDFYAFFRDYVADIRHAYKESRQYHVY